MNENVLRAGLLATAKAMANCGLNTGTAGNASVRCSRGFLITPSGMAYEDCTPEDMALVAMDGSWRGPYAPSSEWRIHRDILAAHAHHVPFYVAAPRSTLDFGCPDGAAIPIEERSADEVRLIAGLDDDGAPARVRIAGHATHACNPAFDVTPARLLAGIICEFGVFPADALATVADR